MTERYPRKTWLAAICWRISEICVSSSRVPLRASCRSERQIALRCKVSSAIRRVNPEIKLTGPSDMPTLLTLPSTLYPLPAPRTMPSLIIEQPGKRSGGTVEGRVLIGRLPTNGIIANGSSVSRFCSLDRRRPRRPPFRRRQRQPDRHLCEWPHHRETPHPRRWRCHPASGEARSSSPWKTRCPTAWSPWTCPASPRTERRGSRRPLRLPLRRRCWFKATTIGQGHTCRHCGRTIRCPDRSGAP